MYPLSEWKSGEAACNGVGGKQSINLGLSCRSRVGSNSREGLGAHCVHQWGLARWFIFISKYSVWSGRNIVVFTFELLLWCVSNSICLNVFAKPKHTRLIILERWGASGKNWQRIFFLQWIWVKCLQIHTWCQSSIHPNFLAGMNTLNNVSLHPGFEGDHESIAKGPSCVFLSALQIWRAKKSLLVW